MSLLGTSYVHRHDIIICIIAVRLVLLYSSHDPLFAGVFVTVGRTSCMTGGSALSRSAGLVKQYNISASQGGTEDNLELEGYYDGHCDRQVVQ